jgi:TatD DNase family protein
MARRAAELGCFFSINARMLGSTVLSRLLDAVPRDRLLLESDAPFLRGDGGKGVRDDLQKVVSALSQQLGLDAGGVVQMVHDNHLRLIQ